MGSVIRSPLLYLCLYIHQTTALRAEDGALGDVDVDTAEARTRR